MFCIYKKQTVIFIAVEDVIQFFESTSYVLNTSACASCASNFLRCQSRTGELFSYQWPDFHQVFWEALQIFISLSGLHQVFPIFKLLNSTVINTFKVIIHLVWKQKLKQPMIDITVTTKNRTCCGFQRWLQTKNGDLPRTEHTHYH